MRVIYQSRALKVALNLSSSALVCRESFVIDASKDLLRHCHVFTLAAESLENYSLIDDVNIHVTFMAINIYIYKKFSDAKFKLIFSVINCSFRVAMENFHSEQTRES